MDNRLAVMRDPGEVLTLPPPPQMLVIGDMVTVHRDGSIEFSSNYTPDVAAQAFWDAVQQMGFRLARGDK